MNLFKVFGIQIIMGVDFLIVLLLASFSVSTSFFPAECPGLSLFQYILMGLGSGVVLFFSIISHEIIHSLVAMRFGIGVREIVLFFGGGVAKIDGEKIKTPKQEFWIAVSGPVYSFFLSGAFILFTFLFSQAEGMKAFSVFFLWGGLINIVLGCFNLIPAGPLDGGRVLHSIIWSKSKNFLKATRVCYILGRGFALILILLGIMFLFIGIIAPFWIIMGVILWNISKREYIQVLLVEKLRQRKIGELDLSTANVSNSDLDKSKAVYASVDEDCYSVLCRLLGASKEIVIISGISPGVTGFVPLNTMVQLIINEANCN